MTNEKLIMMKQPNSFVAQSYKMLRTNINYMNKEGKYKVYMITSSVPGEGKSTTISNLAVSFAQVGQKVLLVDTDLRCGAIHGILNVNQSPGLTDYLSTSIDLAEVIQPAQGIENLDVIATGLRPPYPSELLTSEKLKNMIDVTRTFYDVVLIDAPPILFVSDATEIAQSADGLILVVAANKTQKNEILNAKKAMDKVGVKIIGVAITKSNNKQKGSYYVED